LTTSASFSLRAESNFSSTLITILLDAPVELEDSTSLYPLPSFMIDALTPVSALFMAYFIPERVLLDESIVIAAAVPLPT
jgi:hypothetical protein